MIHFKQYPTPVTGRPKKARMSMAHYFTREEAEALLPQITVVLLKIQEHRQAMQHAEEGLRALRAQSLNNGHPLHERIERLQKALVEQIERLQTLALRLRQRCCAVKAAETGLIRFLSLRGRPERSLRRPLRHAR